jgi:Xaa-Pro aminopeptidase
MEQHTASSDLAIYREKLDQAQQLLGELDIDAWLLFVRETSLMGDPAMDLIAPFDLTWESVLLVGRDGSRTAIVGRYDTQPVEETGLWDRVWGYDASIGESLRDVLGALDPQRIAINYSASEVSADGLTHGLYLRLIELLRPTPYADRLHSAHPFLSRLRAQKTPGELRRLREAIAAAEQMFTLAAQSIRPGVSEREIAALIHEATFAQGMGTAWPAAACPIVNTGPHSPVGHATPTDLRVEPGHLVHIDFGVIRNGFCSDQQRMWYVLAEGESAPPADIQQAFALVREAIERSFATVKPGVQGWQVDEVAREVYRGAGLAEYQHALGHGVGRAVHDGGPLIGPRWDRYGQTPFGVLLPGMVFTLECGIETSRGYLGLEEEIVVTETGAEWLAPPQTELWLIK